MKASRKTLLALIGAMAVGAAVAAPSVEIVSVQQQYPWTNTVDIVYNVEGVTNMDYFVKFTPTTSAGVGIPDVNGQYDIQVALTNSGTYTAQWYPQTNQQYTACKMTPSVFRGAAKDYLIIDLTDWSYTYEPMATQAASNERYNTDEYKTSKLVLRRIEAGKSYTIGHNNYKTMTDQYTATNTPHTVQVTKPYYIGVFEVTAAQYERVMGTNPSQTNPRAVANVSWATLRANALSNARLNQANDSSSSFLIRLGYRTGIQIDLPTEEMWMIAAMAGASTLYPWGDEDSDLYGSGKGVSGYGKGFIPGSYLPNAWGLYDMISNKRELVLDVMSYVDLALKKTDIYTPNASGPSVGTKRNCGGTKIPFRRCNYGDPNGDIGFRLAVVNPMGE